MSYPRLQFNSAEVNTSRDLYQLFCASNLKIEHEKLNGSKAAIVTLRTKLKKVGWTIRLFPDLFYRMIREENAPPRRSKASYERSRPNGKVADLVNIFKAGAELTVDEVTQRMGYTQKSTRVMIAAAAKWLRKEGLFLANVGGGYQTQGKYKIMDESTVSGEANRRYNLIATHFDNVQDLIVSGVEEYGDNPEIAQYLEEILLTLQESQISHKRRLLTKAKDARHSDDTSQ